MALLGRLFFRKQAVPRLAKGKNTSSQFANGWLVVGAAVRGVSHQKLGMPCQDALEYRVLPNGAVLIAVADGAGSASQSELGARLAVMRAMDTLEAKIKRNLPCTAAEWENVIRKAYFRTFGALYRLADVQRRPVRDYATTLTCVVATPQTLAV